MTRALHALAIAALVAGSAVAAPTTESPVDDQANVLSPSDAARLTEELRGLRRDGVEMAVLVVRSTDGVAIETYARNAAEAWATGKRAAAVLVLAIGDRTLRLEVSDALRAKFPDSRSQSILDNQRSALRAADYAGAIRSIVLDVRSVALGAESPTGETVTPPASSPPPPRSSASHAPAIFAIIVTVVVVFGVGALVAVVKRSRTVSLSGGGTLHANPFWLDMLIGTFQVVAAVFVIIAIVASSSSRGSSSSSSWSGGGSSGGSSSDGGGWSGGGSSSGGGSGGWSGGGASSSW